MARDLIRFGVEVPRETDVLIGKLAAVEGRPSKANMHVVLLNRIARLWKDSPSKAVELGLIKPERIDMIQER